MYCKTKIYELFFKHYFNKTINGHSFSCPFVKIKKECLKK